MSRWLGTCRTHRESLARFFTPLIAPFRLHSLSLALLIQLPPFSFFFSRAPINTHTHTHPHTPTHTEWKILCRPPPPRVVFHIQRSRAHPHTHTQRPSPYVTSLPPELLFTCSHRARTHTHTHTRSLSKAICDREAECS